MNLRITKTASMAALKLKKNSPQLLFGAGIAGTVATVVVACRATLKAQKVAEEHASSIAEVETDRLRLQQDPEIHKQAVVALWTQTSIQYARLYGPAFVLGVTSIACLTKSHTILTSRNTAVMAAYAGLDKAYKQYRTRVVEELGENKDRDFANGRAEKEVVDYDKKGNPKVEIYDTADPNAKHLYGRFFDETNRHWDKDHGYNHTFLENQQKWANIELKKHGFLFLNDVYKLLGFEKTKEGQMVGWVYDTTEGDGYIDFGFNRYPEFVAGFERSVFLDFNVDGIILDLI